MEIRHIIFLIFVASAIYVYFRGKVRFGVVRSLTDYQVLLAPVNTLLYLFSKVKPGAFIPVGQFPEMRPIQDNWETIRQEALSLQEGGSIAAATGYNDIGFNSFFRTGWKRFYLKWYDTAHPSAEELCPFTVGLLKQVPNVKAAMFTHLPPGARLVRHRDPYAGSIRYHLGLSTPNDDRCFIEVDGERYSWRDGKSVFFDETFIHYAENDTDKDRLIFFCDVERPLAGSWIQAFNRWFGRYVVGAAASPNAEGDKTGVLNKIFGVVYKGRVWAKGLKSRNRTAYYAGKWVILGGILALILLA